MRKMSKKRVIVGRVTKMQKIKLVGYMKQHPEVGFGNSLGPNNKQKTAQIWRSIGSKLNGYGPEKGWEQWKKTWADWKASIKRLYIANMEFKKRTDDVPLEEVPKKLDALSLAVLKFVHDKDINKVADTDNQLATSPPPDLSYEEADDTTDDIKDPEAFEEYFLNGTEESIDESMNEEADYDEVKSEPKSLQTSVSEKSPPEINALVQRRHDAFFQMAGENLDRLQAEQQDEAKLFFLSYLHKQIYKKNDN